MQCPYVLLNFALLACIYYVADGRKTLQLDETSVRNKRSPSDIINARPSIPSYYYGVNSRHIFSTTRYIEFALVADYSMFAKFEASHYDLNHHIKEVASLVNAIFFPLNIRVILVHVEIWNRGDMITILEDDPETTTKNFMAYRQKRINSKVRNDNAFLLTDRDFTGSHGHTVVGKARLSSMCTMDSSGGIAVDHSRRPISVASTLAHELGHNLGLNHDADTCQCPDTACVMTASTNWDTTVVWSDCSIRQLNKAFEEGKFWCLNNVPTDNTPRRHYHNAPAPVCGNGLTELGEECDCGWPSLCRNKCCNPKTCKLSTGSQCAEGTCCNTSTCEIKAKDTPCRASQDRQCDIAETCDGKNAHCAADIHKPNGHECSQGFCFGGKCASKHRSCTQLWGSGARPSTEQCYNSNAFGTNRGDCGYEKRSKTYSKCTAENLVCGRLHCESDQIFPIIGDHSTVKSAWGTVGTDGSKCQVAQTDFGLGSDDLGMVPNGSPCGEGHNPDTNQTEPMMCVKQQCTLVADILKLNVIQSEVKSNDRNINPSTQPDELDYDNRKVVIITAFVITIGLITIGLLVSCWRYQRSKRSGGYYKSLNCFTAIRDEVEDLQFRKPQMLTPLSGGHSYPISSSHSVVRLLSPERLSCRALVGERKSKTKTRSPTPSLISPGHRIIFPEPPPPLNATPVSEIHNQMSTSTTSTTLNDEDSVINNVGRRAVTTDHQYVNLMHVSKTLVENREEQRSAGPVMTPKTHSDEIPTITKSVHQTQIRELKTDNSGIEKVQRKLPEQLTTQTVAATVQSKTNHDNNGNFDVHTDNSTVAHDIIRPVTLHGLKDANGNAFPAEQIVRSLRKIKTTNNPKTNTMAKHCSSQRSIPEIIHPSHLRDSPDDLNANQFPVVQILRQKSCENILNSNDNGGMHKLSIAQPVHPTLRNLRDDNGNSGLVKSASFQNKPLPPLPSSVSAKSLSHLHNVKTHSAPNTPGKLRKNLTMVVKPSTPPPPPPPPPHQNKKTSLATVSLKPQEAWKPTPPDPATKPKLILSPDIEATPIIKSFSSIKLKPVLKPTPPDPATKPQLVLDQPHSLAHGHNYAELIPKSQRTPSQ